MTRTARVVITVLAIVAIGFGAAAAWQYWRAEKAEEQLGLDAGRVLSAVFTKARELRVARLNGVVLARSQDDGWFDSEQETRAPYNTNYFVDLKRIGRSDYVWNAERRTMVVRIPDVVIEKPSIDMSRAQVKQRGFWVSRRAGIELQRNGAAVLAQTATAKARSDENMGKARIAAAEAVRDYLQEPLAAAGFPDVVVDVRFPWEGRRSPEQWDRSRRPEEVLADRP